MYIDFYVQILLFCGRFSPENKHKLLFINALSLVFPVFLFFYFFFSPVFLKIHLTSGQ